MTHEIIVVYFGTVGTDSISGMIPAVRDMKSALQRQAAAAGTKVVVRGVSLEPSIDEGVRHLASFGAFDEISVGGNWTNSSVVHYLGNNLADHSVAVIPQVVVLEREVSSDGYRSLVVSPEKEIGRYIGTGKISGWVKTGAPLKK